MVLDLTFALYACYLLYLFKYVIFSFQREEKLNKHDVSWFNFVEK